MGRVRILFVTGQQPVLGKQINLLLQAFDLGIEGVFEPFCDKITLNLKEGVSEEQLRNQEKAITIAYEEQGCTNITILEAKDR